MDKKKLLYTILILVFIIVITVLLIMKNYNKDKVYVNNKIENDISLSLVGTWYSNKPDMVTFNSDGIYKFSSWNNGNPWLTFSGTYSLINSNVQLNSNQDGTNLLSLETSIDGNYILVGKYTYYQTEDEAMESLKADKEAAEQAETNIIPNTINNLLGEWISIDKTVNCTFTENSINVYFHGNNILPKETLYYEYELLNDKQIIISKSGIKATYSYSLTEKDGEYTFHCNGIEYASTYNKGGTLQEKIIEEDTVTKEISDTIISSEKDPDKSEYTEELSNYVNELIIGTWRGTFDDWPNEDSVYWIYSFDINGNYTFTDGVITENGTYIIKSDTNNNYYHSELLLTFDGNKRTIPFYFTTTNPIKMITDDKTDPTFLKD